MALTLLTCGAVPFNLPVNSNNIAKRRQRKNGAGVYPEQLQYNPEEMVRLATVDAVQFVIGPNYRPGVSSPTYRIPQKMIKCPPNTPNNAMSFEFDLGTEADCSASEEESENLSKKKNRKRRRLCSFSNSTPSSRRVPNKKKADTQDHQTQTEMSQDLPDHLDIVPRLTFYQDVQKAADPESITLEDQERWRKLGSSLRNIADKFEQQNGVTISKDVTDIVPNGVWTAVLKYIFWKIIKGMK